MERAEAVSKLERLKGVDLVPLARKYGVTMWKDGKLNKGWAGHVLERHLGLPLNSSQSPNFGSWELKLVPLKKLRTGKMVPKETMAITMIDSVHVEANPFESSHLLSKLRKAVICARLFESKEERKSELVQVATFDLDDPAIFDAIKADYEETRAVIKTRGFDYLTGKMGKLVQPRTKGPGHGSTSRAFYGRKELVHIVLAI